MKNYNQIANGIYEAGLRKVATTPEPIGQLFPIGSFVKIEQDPDFPSKEIEIGKVEYTYAHAFWGDETNKYSLLCRYGDGEWSSVAWFFGRQLELIKDPDEIKRYEEEITNQKE